MIAGMAPLRDSVSSELTLVLNYQETVLRLTPYSQLALGRGKQTELPIQETLASRLHGRIEYARDKFIFVDQSTNGTYIKRNDYKESYLKRESLPLDGEGKINLGRSTQYSDHIVHYKCEIN